ncbi:hypothetical protein AVEN_121550-1 [Araneus ventricosus]|uniref:Uncharacterized protein n=1 Tax=Araneus ventricosus TaxID=182803 RepID=A0A4Y2GPE6_ARAVE|nr:hypothetical protein AVEN_121550-1 [Araneus ventricosus]
MVCKDSCRQQSVPSGAYRTKRSVAKKISNQSIPIHVDNDANIQAAPNPRSNNSLTNDTTILPHSDVHVVWIKVCSVMTATRQLAH